MLPAFLIFLYSLARVVSPNAALNLLLAFLLAAVEERLSLSTGSISCLEDVSLEGAGPSPVVELKVEDQGQQARSLQEIDGTFIMGNLRRINRLFAEV